jgi:PA domain
MKPLILFCILTIAKTGGSIDTRDSSSDEKQKDFINNGVVNTFAGLPVADTEPKLENLLEISDSSRYITLAFLNVSWFENGMEKFKEDEHEKSKYGMGRVMDVTGRLVHVSDAEDLYDHSACNASLTDSFGNSLSRMHSVPWIALIKRGGCDFEKKILHVYNYRAVGAIIYNNNSGTELNYMKIMNKVLLEGNITSVFTPLYKGTALARIVQEHGEHNPVYVSIKQGTRFDKKTSLNHRSSVLFVTISFIIVMVISMLWLIVYYYQRFRYLQTKENEQKMDSNKAKEALRKIPTKTIKTLSKVSLLACSVVCFFSLQTYLI